MSEKKCNEEKILRFIEGDLSREEEKLIKEEIKLNPICKKIYEFHSSLENELLKLNNSVEVPQEFSLKIMSKINKYKPENLFELKEVFFAIAVFLVLFFILFLINGNTTNKVVSGVFKGFFVSIKSLSIFVIKFLHVVFLSLYNLLYSFVLLGKGLGEVVLEHTLIFSFFVIFTLLLFMYKYRKVILSGFKKR